MKVCQGRRGATDQTLDLLELTSRLVCLDISQRPLVTTAMMGPGAGPGDGTEKAQGQT